jgi:hypothetical protein
MSNVHKQLSCSLHPRHCVEQNDLSNPASTAINPDGAEIPFDNVLDRITGADPCVTDYILEYPALCPYCGREIREKTLVEPA